MNDRLPPRKRSIAAICLGTLLVGPLVNDAVTTLYAAVHMLLAGRGSLALLVPRADLLVEGAAAGLVAGIVCGKTQGERWRTATRTGRITLVFWALMLLLRDALLFPLINGRFPPVAFGSVLGELVRLGLYGLAAAATGYLTAALTDAWHWQPPACQAPPPRHRPERYVI